MSLGRAFWIARKQTVVMCLFPLKIQSDNGAAVVYLSLFWSFLLWNECPEIETRREAHSRDGFEFSGFPLSVCFIFGYGFYLFFALLHFFLNDIHFTVN